MKKILTILLFLIPAITFAGVNFSTATGVVSVSNFAKLNADSGNLTLLAWVYARSTGGGTVGYAIANLVAPNSGYQFGVGSGGSGQMQLTLFNGAGTSYPSSNGMLPFNKWVCVATVLDRNANTISFYRNGISFGQATAVQTYLPSTATFYAIGNNALSAGTRNWDGMISNVMVWNRILSQQEITGDCISGRPSSSVNLQLFLPLFNGLNVQTDFSGNRSTARLLNTGPFISSMTPIPSLW